MKKRIAALLICLIALSFISASALEVDTTPVTLYLTSKDESDFFGAAYDTIEVEGLKGASKVTDVKSSNSKVVEVSSWKKVSTVEHMEGMFEDDDTVYVTRSHTLVIELFACKAGTATISFKIDGKTYKKKYEVRGYANPIRSLVLTGVSDKNLKGKFSKHDWADLKLKKKAGAGYLKLSAAPGWWVRSATLEADSWEEEWKHTFRSEDIFIGSKSMKKRIPAMKKNGAYILTMDFYNLKTGGEQSIRLYIGKW